MKRGTFGELIRSRRREMRKTLQEVADRLGVPVAYVSEVELGKRPPFREDKLGKLAEFLELDARKLLLSAWKNKKMISFDTGELSEAEKNILTSFARGGISPERIERIQKVLDEE
jgi:transcriptional regulator with XRE-family HTH domain